MGISSAFDIDDHNGEAPRPDDSLVDARRVGAWHRSRGYPRTFLPFLCGPLFSVPVKRDVLEAALGGWEERDAKIRMKLGKLPRADKPVPAFDPVNRLPR